MTSLDLVGSLPSLSKLLLTSNFLKYIVSLKSWKILFFYILSVKLFHKR